MTSQDNQKETRAPMTSPKPCQYRASLNLGIWYHNLRLETFVLNFQSENLKFCAHSDINVEVKEALKQPCSRLTRSMLNPIFIPCRRQDDDDDYDDQDGICALYSEAFLYALVSHFVLLHIFTLIWHLTQIFISFCGFCLRRSMLFQFSEEFCHSWFLQFYKLHLLFFIKTLQT